VTTHVLDPSVVPQDVDRDPERPTFRGPDHFVNGIPHRFVKVGTDETGTAIYGSCELEIPSEMPSMYWREGC
jgi:hypothetical protein